MKLFAARNGQKIGLTTQVPASGELVGPYPRTPQADGSNELDQTNLFQ